MAQQFTYDEKGSTFYYFLLSFFAMILVPFSYFFWPQGLRDDEKRLRSQSVIHGKSKWYKKEQDEFQRKRKKPSFRKLFVVLCWIGFFSLVYRVSNIENDFVEYDPYEVLGVGREATKIELKKRYRQLSLEYHPDKGGDPETFMKIRKAYEALTDEEIMENWKNYGNPDGPRAMEFGIALPKWIVESQNSIFVLGIYMVLFMVILPVVVGIWWNRSIRYSKEQVLLKTTHLYYYFINKTPNMMLKRALMVLSGSFEFNREYNSKVRASTPQDNEELPELIRILEKYSITENAKEYPLNFPYSVKARVLMYCHLCRIPIPSKELEQDVEFILMKVSLLIQEMVSCVSQLTAMAHWNKAAVPRLETLENIMKLSPMMVQGLRDNKSALLQLPYFSDEFVKYCTFYKKHSVRSLQGLAMLKESERRQLLRRMGDEEYDTMISVLKNFPDIDMNAETLVMDDEEVNVITAGAIVTVSLHLIRKTLGDLQEEEAQEKATNEDVDNEEDEPQEKPAVVKAKPWEKQKKKKNVKKKKSVKKVPKKLEKSKTDVNSATETAPLPIAAENADEGDHSDDNDSHASDTEKDNIIDDEKEEKEWQAMQAEFKKKEKAQSLIGDKRTHTVYAPMFPAEKQEWWWAYICDRKNHSLMTVPTLITNLIESTEFEMKFPAPQKPGRYTYSVYLRSDSYFDCDRRQDIKLDVKEAKPVEEDHPQWHISEDEDNDNAESEDEGISSDEQSSDA